MPRSTGQQTEKESPFLAPLTADQTIFWSSVGLILCVVALGLLAWHAVADRKRRIREDLPDG